jgi:hypothetical protein
MKRRLSISAITLRSIRLELMAIITLLLIVTSLPKPVVQAAASDLDVLFGSGGKVTTNF